jgi:galactonate dehydratase
MKITKIEPLIVNAEMRNWIFVKVETDQAGLYGWGEATLEWKTRAVVGAIQDLAPLLIGRDPRDITQALRIMTKRAFWRAGIIGSSAISGIEHALWDIFGKSVGLPVWRLLGGQVRDRVKIYTHLGLGDMQAVYRTMEVEPLREHAARLVEAGYQAFKVVFIPYTHYTTSAQALRHVGKLMQGLRKQVGEAVDIMIDIHGRCGSASAALQYIRELEPFDPLFVEEPLQPGDVESLRAITEQARCPIATGERLVGLEEFEPLFRNRAVNIAQPDLNHCGGITVARDIAAAAAAASIGIAPHNPNGPVAGAAALHFAVATPNHVIQEVMDGSVPWYDEVMAKTPIRRSGAYWEVPQEPGLGIEINEQAAARHPFKQEHFESAHATLPDGTVVDW